MMSMAQSIARLFPPGVMGAEIADGSPAGPLFAEERSAVEGVVEKRARDFTAGRHCARLALAALGHEPVPLPREPDGTPAWPAGVVGSISHCDGYCAAVVSSSRQYVGLGLDVEVRGRVDSRIWTVIATASELEVLRQLDPVRGTEFASLLFSAKEAAFKAQYPATRARLDFQDVAFRVIDDKRFEVSFSRDVLGFGPSGTPVEGAYSRSADHVFAGVALGRKIPGEDVVEDDGGGCKWGAGGYDCAIERRSALKAAGGGASRNSSRPSWGCTTDRLSACRPKVGPLVP